MNQDILYSEIEKLHSDRLTFKKQTQKTGDKPGKCSSLMLF